VCEVLAAREPVIQRELARQVADPAMDLHALPARVEAEHGDGPGGRADQIEHRPDRGGLARAVRPEVAEDLPGRDDEVEVDHAALAAVRLVSRSARMTLAMPDNSYRLLSQRPTWVPRTP
jgi:hypothetical protein